MKQKDLLTRFWDTIVFANVGKSRHNTAPPPPNNPPINKPEPSTPKPAPETPTEKKPPSPPPSLRSFKDYYQKEKYGAMGILALTLILSIWANNSVDHNAPIPKDKCAPGQTTNFIGITLGRELSRELTDQELTTITDQAQQVKPVTLIEVRRNLNIGKAVPGTEFTWLADCSAVFGPDQDSINQSKQHSFASKLRAEKTGLFYVVQPGDTAESIAELFSVPLEMILRANGLNQEPQPGQTLVILNPDST